MNNFMKKFKAKKCNHVIAILGYALINACFNNKICKQSAATASQVHMDTILPDQVNIAHFGYFETQLFDIFRHDNFTCTERASVENRLL